MSKLEKDVRDLISRYVAGIDTLETLSHGLPDGHDLDAAKEPDVKHLVLLTIGYLADYQRDNLSESELRRLLSAEASWHLDRISTTAVTPDPPQAPVETRVRAGAGTEPQGALAS